MCLFQGGGRGELIWRTPPPPPPGPNDPLTQNHKTFALGKNEILNGEPKMRGPFWYTNFFLPSFPPPPPTPPVPYTEH